MGNHSETVKSIMEKRPNEIKRWLSEFIDKEVKYKDKLIDFNILLLEECVNSRLSKIESQDIAIEWAELEFFILSLLKEIYPCKKSFFYDSTMMQIRISLISKFGEDPKSDVLNTQVIMNWINLESITFDKLNELHNIFINKNDKKTLDEYIEIRSKTFVLNELVKKRIIIPDEKINTLISYVTSNVFFASD